MSSNQPNINMFGGRFRETPAPVTTTVPDLAVPTDVPFVAPPNIIPQNLAAGYASTGLARMASLLGEAPAAINRLTAGITKAQGEKQKLRDSLEYGAGIQEATLRASKAQKTYEDLETFGLPKFKNKFRELGYLSVLGSELASNYTVDLEEARRANPTAPPEEVRDGIKQKYAQLISKSGFRPDVAGTFFYEKTNAADLKDAADYSKNRDKQFEADLAISVGKGVDLDVISQMSALDSNPTLVKVDPTTKVSPLQTNLLRAVESRVEILFATNPNSVNSAMEAGVNSIRRAASTRKTLEEKLAVLDTLQELKDPNGNKWILRPDSTDAFNKYRQEAITTHNTEQDTALKAQTLKEKVSTSALIQKMSTDKANGELLSLNDYLNSPEGIAAGVDVGSVREGFSNIGGGNRVDKDRTNAVLMGLSPLIDRLNAGGGNVDDSIMYLTTALQNGNISNEEFLKAKDSVMDAFNAGRSKANKSWPHEELTSFLPTATPFKGVSPVIVSRMSKGGTFDPARGLSRGVTNMGISAINRWVEQNPNHTPEQRRTFIGNWWNDIGKEEYESRFKRMVASPTLAESIANTGTAATANSRKPVPYKATTSTFTQPASTQPKPSPSGGGKQVQPSPSKVQPVAPQPRTWRTDKAAYDREYEQFRLGRGDMYKSFRASLERSGNTPDEIVKKHNLWSNRRKMYSYAKTLRLPFAPSVER